MWLNVSVLTLNVMLKLLVIYRFGKSETSTSLKSRGTNSNQNNIFEPSLVHFANAWAKTFPCVLT